MSSSAGVLLKILEPVTARAPCVNICRPYQLLASTFTCSPASVRQVFGPLRQDLPASASTFVEPTKSGHFNLVGLYTRIAHNYHYVKFL
jgi:hypothetical protein